MAKSSNSKLKMMALAELFLEKTDDEHGVTMQEIRDYLESRDIQVERRTIYNDLDDLRRLGYDIIAEIRGRHTIYYLGSRKFELPELKILADAVSSSRFISERKSKELIEKISSLTSVYHAQELVRNVTLSRTKSSNESIYYTIDFLYTAIHENKKIRFQYFKYDQNKQQVLRKDGALCEISPWKLVFDRDQYYLIAYDSEAQQIKHFRIDRMLHPELTDLPRDGADLFKDFDTASYVNKLFSMFSGDIAKVTLICKNKVAPILLDHFGFDLVFDKLDDETFMTQIEVAVSGKFFSWIMALGDDVRIESPDWVVDKMRSHAKKLYKLYK